jgi:hypothetical protein
MALTSPGALIFGHLDTHRQVANKKKLFNTSIPYHSMFPLGCCVSVRQSLQTDDGEPRGQKNDDGEPHGQKKCAKYFASLDQILYSRK